MANTKSITRDLKKVQAKLRGQLQELQNRLSLVVKQGRQIDTEDTKDVADQAVSSYEKEILFTRGSYENAQLRRIQQALDYATSLGCNAAQGYVVSRPVNAGEIETFIKTWQWRKNAMTCKPTDMSIGEASVLQNHAG